jgi:hypothetical protein
MPKTRKCIKTPFLLCFSLPSSFFTIPILFSLFRTLHFILVTEILLIKTNGKCSLGSTVKMCASLLLDAFFCIVLCSFFNWPTCRGEVDKVIGQCSWWRILRVCCYFASDFSKSILKKWKCVFYGSLYCTFHSIYFFFQLNLYFVRLCLGPTANKCQTL